MKRLLFLLPFLFGALAADAQEEPKLTLSQATAKLQKADKALNAAYAAAKKTLAEEDFVQLREEQKGWIEWRTHIALSPNYGDVPADEKEARKSAGFFSTSADLTKDRSEWLLGLVQQIKQEDDHMTGHWTDSYGGNLDIVEKDGDIYFNLDVVRGRGANIGQIAGTARWHSRIAMFSDKGRDKDKKDEATLSFVYKNARLHITEAGADYYHGHSASFDGDYVKVKPLTDKEQKEILQAGKTGEAPGR